MNEIVESLKKQLYSQQKISCLHHSTSLCNNLIGSQTNNGKSLGLAQKWKFWSTWKFDKNSFVIATVSNAFPDNLFFFCCWKSINNDQVPNVQIPPHPLLLPPKIRTIQQNANSNGCQHRPHFLLKLEIFSFFVEKVRLVAVPDGCGFYVSRQSLLTPPLK